MKWLREAKGNVNAKEFIKQTEIKGPKDIIPFFEQLFEKKYGVIRPKITTTKDGIYIYGFSTFLGEPQSTSSNKLFILLDDFMEYPEFYDTYLENAHDTIMHAMAGDLDKAFKFKG